MSGSTLLLLAQVCSGAICLVLHGALALRALRYQQHPIPVRVAALVPPVAAGLAWYRGARKLPLMFVGACLAYAALRAGVWL